MAIIDMVRWTPNGDKTVYAYRFPETNLSTLTQLVVYESQEAILFSKGQIIGKFGPGKHTLNTENIPLLRNLFGIPFGGKNPFTAEVWFVNKIQMSNLPWTIASLPIFDSRFNTQIPLEFSGRYGIKLTEAEKFLVKIVGTKEEFTEDDLTDQFLGEFSSKVKSFLVQYMNANRVGYESITAIFDDLSKHLQTELSPFWADLGFVLTRFYMTDVKVDKSTEEGRRIAEAIAQRSSMDITGHTWQQEQMFGVAGDAVNGMGNGQGGLLGGLMAMGMMGGMSSMGAGNAALMQPTGQPAGQHMGGMSGMMQQGQPMQQPTTIFCAACSRPFPKGTKFCPNCGHKYNPCPNCGRDNDDDAKRCVGCGAVLQNNSSNCPNCNAPVKPGTAFCPNCGKPIQSGDTCSRCGTAIQPGTRFCPVCGNKIN